MTPEEIPQELVDMLDADAGKQHSRAGPVLASLARILTRYEELQASDDEAGLRPFLDQWNA